MNNVVFDDFTGTNGASIDGRTPTVGPDTWHNDPSATGVWTIEGNKARQSGLYPTYATNRVYTDSGVSGTVAVPVTITVSVTIPTGNGSRSPGVVFRYVDNSNNWYIVPDATGGTLYLVEGVTVRGTAPLSMPAGTYAVSIVLSGTSITCTYGGATIGPITSSANQTATKHGIQDYFDGAGGNGSRSEYDNFRVQIPTTGVEDLQQQIQRSRQRRVPTPI